MKNKYAKALSLLLAAVVTAGTTAAAMPAYNVYADESVANVLTELITDADVAELTKKVENDRVSVHDPSVIYDNNGTYYIFGSHMAVAKTTDLMNWSEVTNESTTSRLFANTSGEAVSYEEAFKENAYTGAVKVTDKNGKEYEVDLGSYNAAEWISENTVQGNMWAPDVIYNENMQKWCMYLSLNGAKWNSAVILLTADSIEGPYTYQAPVVFSGFSTSTSSKSYKDTDLEIVLGELDELPEKYQKISDNTWGTYWPHAIDPCVFYDEDGKLWMSYGSWSGGIYMLELDENTGLRDYTVNYESNYDTLGASVTSDEYFGKKIAGGYYVSGEGSYIEKIGNYYYLFMSYGFYSPEGGYNMRVFKSENPDGPYVDANGTSAIFDKYIMNYSATSTAYNRGLKLIGNYKWSTMSTAEVAQGHNSAIVTEDGKAFVIYHTKFNDGTAGHQIRVHQLFTNANGDLVAAPYEYSGETLLDKTYKNSTVAGDYEFIVHDFQIDYANLEYVKSVNITLNEDGTVTGDYTGTYSLDSNARITLAINGKEYKGVLVEQNIDGLAAKTLCFTAASTDGLCIWGSKLLGDEYVVAQNVESLNISVPSITYGNITLPAEGDNGVSVEWESSNESVLSSSGVVTKPEKDTDVTLTLTVSKGKYYYTKDYKVTVAAAAQNETDRLLLGSYFENEEVDISKGLDKSISVANPFYNGVTGGLDVTGGLTVEFDVKSTGDLHMLGTILSFMGNGGNAGRLYFTPGSYLGFNGSAGYFDANVLNYGLVNDYIGESAHVAINFNDEGFKVSVDDKVVYTEEIIGTEAGSGNVTDYSKVVSWLNETADTIYFGYGSWWNAAGYDEANCTVSNVKFYAEPVAKAKELDVVSEEFGTHELNAEYIKYYENPFYKKNVDKVYLEYTIKTNENSINNGWDGILSFYNSETGGRVSVQTAPYVCYNDTLGNWIDINQPGVAGGTNAAVDFAAGEEHKVAVLISADKVVISVDGEQIATGENGSGAAYSDILEFITKCDKFTVGVGTAETAYWSTEYCTVSDILVSSTGDIKEEEVVVKTDVASLVKELKAQYDVTSAKLNDEKLSTNTVVYYDNVFADKALKAAFIEFTLNFDETAAKNGWDGVLSFYNEKTGGRVSIQTAPYICFNDAEGNWTDINSPAASGSKDVAPSLTSGEDHVYTILMTESSLIMQVDGVDVAYSVAGTGATYADILSFIAGCDKITVGTGEGVTGYWFTENSSISNITVEGFTEKSQASGPAAGFEYITNAAWGNCVQGTLKITNTTNETIKSWKVKFDYAAEITQIWGAEIESHEGNTYVIKYPSWSKNLEAGKSAEFGFIAQYENDKPVIEAVNFVGEEVQVSEAAAKVDFAHNGEWSYGFNAAINFKNVSGSTIDNWTMEFDYADLITNMWGAVIISHTGNHYVLSNQGYNADIRNNESITIGFSGIPDAAAEYSTAVIENVKVTTMK